MKFRMHVPHKLSRNHIGDIHRHGARCMGRVRKRRVFWQMDCLLGLTSLGTARVGSRPFVTQVGGILLPPNKVAKASALVAC